MNKCVPAAILIALLSLPAFSDSIDDAEAKRRGIPVGQVEAEKALAKEKAKTTALEKQLADLQKKMAELNGGGAADGGGAGAGGAGDRGGTVGGIGNSVPANVEGPRESSPLYDDIVHRYLAGDWTTLSADIAAKEKEIKVLPAGNAADIAYIKQALAESRPAWWDQVKAGRLTTFKQSVWKQPVTINYSSAAARLESVSALNGNVVGKVTWPVDYMDSRDPVTLAELGLGVEGTYTRTDVIDRTIWTLMGDVAAFGMAGGPDKVKAFSPQDKAQFERFAWYMEAVTSAYYSTPTARRIGVVFSMVSFQESPDTPPDWAHRRALGAMLLSEFKGHPYDSMKLLGIAGLKPETPEAEMFFGRTMVTTTNVAQISLQEDRRLRAAIKAFAEANLDWKKEALTLPNNLKFALDPAKDQEFRKGRVAFYLDRGPQKNP